MVFFAKHQLQIAIQPGRRQPPACLRGQISQITRDVDIVGAQVQRALPRGLKRRGFAADIKLCPIQRKRQMRLHLRFYKHRQAGNKRHTNFDLVDLVTPPRNRILEINLATFDTNVVNRKARQAAVADGAAGEGLSRSDQLYCWGPVRTSSRCGCASVSSLSTGPRCQIELS